MDRTASVPPRGAEVNCSGVRRLRRRDAASGERRHPPPLPCPRPPVLPGSGRMPPVYQGPCSGCGYEPPPVTPGGPCLLVTDADEDRRRRAGEHLPVVFH